MVFGPEWEVKLQEKSWLLCCAEILGKLGFLLAAAAQTAALFAHMQHLGQPRFFGSWGSEPLKAVVLLNAQGDPRNP